MKVNDLIKQIYMDKIYYIKFLNSKGLLQDDAEELFQECICRLYFKGYLEAFDFKKAAFKTYICKILLHQIINNHRKLKLRTVDIDTVFDSEVGHEDNWINKRIQQDAENRIINDIGKLPKELRDIFIERFEYGRKYNDIVNDWNVNIDTLKTRYFRAIVILKRKHERRLLCME